MWLKFHNNGKRMGGPWYTLQIPNGRETWPPTAGRRALVEVPATPADNGSVSQASLPPPPEIGKAIRTLRLTVYKSLWFLALHTARSTTTGWLSNLYNSIQICSWSTNYFVVKKRLYTVKPFENPTFPESLMTRIMALLGSSPLELCDPACELCDLSCLVWAWKKFGEIFRRFDY